MLGITYKALVPCHRIREAMTRQQADPWAATAASVQADETYYGNTSKRAKHYKKGHSQKSGVVALVEPRPAKPARSQLSGATAEKVANILVRTFTASTK